MPPDITVPSYLTCRYDYLLSDNDMCSNCIDGSNYERMFTWNRDEK